MDLGLKGKTAIVTGASRGIGRSIAELLAAEGANVAICARNPDQVAEAVASLETQGVRAWGKAVDIADSEGFKAFVAGAVETLGGLDILVSNASALVEGWGEEAWRGMFEVDMLGAVRSFEIAKPHLEAAAAKSGDASFVIISSVSAAEASRISAYGAMKAALIHFAKGVAKQEAKRKVRCNVVSPGTVLFEGGVWDQVRINQPDFFATMIERNPTGRMATPEEIASAAVFLASPRSAYTSGINMVVDGAITSRVNF
jgi:3-oxoacyl-[acyl-carrier protein] reductase